MHVHVPGAVLAGVRALFPGVQPNKSTKPRTSSQVHGGNAVTLASSTPGDGDGDGKGKGEEDGEGDGSRSLPDAATVSGSSQASVAKPSPFRTN